MTITMPMEHCYCATCFIPFAMTELMYERRHLDGQTFYCPAGHENVFATKDDPAELAERRAKIKELHDAEQGEARAADRAAKLDAVGTTAEPETDGMLAAYQPDANGTYHCPHCKQVYRSPGVFGKHVRNRHKIEPITGQPIPIRSAC